MDGFFIIGNMNSILYYDTNAELNVKFVELAKENGLMASTENGESLSDLDTNVILQLLNPILASQKMMFSQFDNNYSALLGNDNFNIAYDEYFGNMFVRISTIYSTKVQKEILQSAIGFSRMICGPDLMVLKNDSKGNFLRRTLSKWTEDHLNNYYSLVDASRTYLMRQDKYNSIMCELRNEMKVVVDLIGAKSNAILLYKEQIVCLYSNQQSYTMVPKDVSMLCQLVNDSDEMDHFNVYLNGASNYECVPITVFITDFRDLEMKLIITSEADNVDIAKSIYKAMTFFNKVYHFNLRLDADNVKAVIDKIDVYVKQVLDALKTNKSYQETLVKMLDKQWSTMKKKFAELSKISYKEVLNNLDAGLPLLGENLLQIFKAVYPDQTHMAENETVLKMNQWFSTQMFYKLENFSKQHFEGSRTSNMFIHSYMEEFPGLIHFIFINRTTGRIIAPDLIPKRTIIDTQNIRNYIQMSKKYAAKGVMSNIWKNPSYCFSYFIWYEDGTGGYLKSKNVLKSNQTKQNPVKEGNYLTNTFNDLTEELNSHSNYYQKITETFFSKQETVHGFELYLFHLAFVSSTCALEHCRRIAATINDVLSSTDNHWDLL